MNCEKMEIRLHDYLDGLLPDGANREVEAHLKVCERCREEVRQLRSLLENVSALPRSIEPPRDLWPEIDARLAEQKKRLRLRTLLPRQRDGVGAPDYAQDKTYGRFDFWPVKAARFAIAASALLLIAGSIWFFIQSRQASWKVASLAGAPQAGDRRIEKTGRLAVGEWLETDSASQAMITVGMIGQVKIEPNTRIRLVQARLTDHRLDLARGKMHASIWAPPRLFFVETAAALAIDLGCEYTMQVEDNGSGLLQVSAGYVALESHGRESVVPAGALCAMRPGIGPGTPYADDASEALRSALARFDFHNAGDAALDTVLAEARFADTFTLWHLLIRVDPSRRPRVYDRMVELIPPPEGVTREGVLRGDKKMLDKWAETFGLGFSWWRYWLPL